MSDIEITVTPPAPVQISVSGNQGPRGPQGVFPIAASVELAWDEGYPSNYTETTFDVDGVIERVDIYDNEAKDTHLFSKVFNYDVSGVLEQIVITKELDGSTMTKDLVYSGGTLVSVKRTYTPAP